MNLSTLLKTKKAVIFDMDGTLIDSMWMWGRIDEEYLARFGIDVPEHLQEDIEGMGYTENAIYFKDRFGIPDSLEQIMQDWHDMAADKYRHEVPLKPGAYDLLCELHKKHYLLGIATSNSRELAMLSLDANQITGFFDCILTADDAKKGKPAPDIYLAVAEHLGVLPEDCLVFEDVPMGILAGKNAGMTVCAVADDFSRDRTEEILRLADYYIKDFQEV